MRRRKFITLIGGAAAWPLVTRAQEPGRTYRLGYLSQVGRQMPWYIAFFDELRLSGFIDMAYTPGLSKSCIKIKNPNSPAMLRLDNESWNWNKRGAK